MSAQAKHNVFTAGNKWNWQGQWQLAKYGLLDYGLGTENLKTKNGLFFRPVPDKECGQFVSHYLHLYTPV